MLAVAILAAVGAGFCNGLAAVLQQGAAKRLGGRTIFLATATMTRRNTRAVAFALAAASLYGVTAGLVKVTTAQLTQGLLTPLAHPELYAAIGTGLGGVVLTQNALKAGALAAPVAVLTLGDPLVGLAVGLSWLGETITATASAVSGEVITLGVMAAGVIVLAGQSPKKAAPTGGRATPESGSTPSVIRRRTG